MKKKNLKLKAAIVESGMTYDDLALAIGVTKPTIARAVSGESIHLFTAKEICTALKKDLNQLFGDDNKSHGE